MPTKIENSISRFELITGTRIFITKNFLVTVYHKLVIKGALFSVRARFSQSFIINYSLIIYNTILKL